MASRNPQSVEINLLGQKIVLKTAGEDPEFVGEVIALVTNRLKDAENRSKSPAPHHVALLALLDLGSEYAHAKKRAGEHRRAIDEKSQELLGMIEAELK
jgi:hypothetical protein